MVKAEFKIKGIEQLQQKLLQKKEAIERMLGEPNQGLLYLIAEEAVRDAKFKKGYRDHTANLKNTISFALFKDGELVAKCVNTNNELPADMSEQAVQENEINNRLMEYASKEGVIRPKGFSLIIVAPMKYAAHVEHKGYNVLQLTRYFLRDEMKKALERALLATK